MPIASSFCIVERSFRLDSGFLMTSLSPSLPNLASTLLVFSLETSASTKFPTPSLGTSPVCSRSFIFRVSASSAVFRNWFFDPLPSVLWYWTTASVAIVW